MKSDSTTICAYNILTFFHYTAIATFSAKSKYYTASVYSHCTAFQ